MTHYHNSDHISYPHSCLRMFLRQFFPGAMKSNGYVSEKLTTWYDSDKFDMKFGLFRICYVWQELVSLGPGFAFISMLIINRRIFFHQTSKHKEGE